MVEKCFRQGARRTAGVLRCAFELFERVHSALGDEATLEVLMLINRWTGLALMLNALAVELDTDARITIPQTRQPPREEEELQCAPYVLNASAIQMSCTFSPPARRWALGRYGSTTYAALPNAGLERGRALHAGEQVGPGHSSFVLTYTDDIREDHTTAPKFGRTIVGNADKIVPLERRAN